jgi:hypothetical protein
MDFSLDTATLEQVLAASPDAICICGRDGAYLYANPAAERLLRAPRAELVGKTGRDVGVSPVAMDIFDAHREEVMRSGEPSSYELVGPSTGRSFQCILSPIRDGRGEVSAVAVIMRDIDDRKRSDAERLRLLALQREVRDEAERQREALARTEARFRRIYEAGIIGVVFWRRDGRITEANDAFLQMVGYEREELVTGRVSWAAMTPPELEPRDAQAFAELEATGICTPFEKAYIHKDGHLVPILLGIACWEGSREEGVAWILDISERKRAEEERTELLARERRANRLKDEFLATVSHELRTPLNAVLGWAKILAMKGVDRAMLEKGLAVIARNAEAQARLVEDLLDVSRIITGKLTLKLARVDVNEVVQGAAAVVQPMASAREVTVDLALGKSRVVTLADPDRLQQVVWNLVMNAVKFSPSGSRVEARVTREDGVVRIDVRDQGKGISPAFLPHLFEPFRQEDQSTTRAHGGLGIGLALVHRLVELHGGSVSAESAGEGTGAVFTVRLPIRDTSSPLP